MPEVDRPVDLSSKIIYSAGDSGACEQLDFTVEGIIAQGIPPPPVPLEPLPSARLARQGCQNLEPKELRYQNLDSKRLARYLASSELTASALTMMT
jgi:hypothetical protein